MTPINTSIQTTDPLFKSRLSIYENSFPDEFPVSALRGIVTSYLGYDDLHAKLGFFSSVDTGRLPILTLTAQSDTEKEKLKSRQITCFTQLISEIPEEQSQVIKDLPFPKPNNISEVYENLTRFVQKYPLEKIQEIKSLIRKVNSSWVDYLNHRFSIMGRMIKTKGNSLEARDLVSSLKPLFNLTGFDPMDHVYMHRLITSLPGKHVEILAALMEGDLGIHSTLFFKGEILLTALQAGCSFTLGDLINKRNPKTSPEEFMSKFSLNVPQLKEKLLSRFFYTNHELCYVSSFEAFPKDKKDELLLLCSSKEWDSKYVIDMFKGISPKKFVFLHEIGFPLTHESEDLLSLFSKLEEDLYFYKACCIFVESSSKDLLPLALKRILDAIEKENGTIGYDNLISALNAISLLLENLQSVDSSWFDIFECMILSRTAVKLAVKKEILSGKIKGIMHLVSTKQSSPPLSQASSVVPKTKKRKRGKK